MASAIHPREIANRLTDNLSRRSFVTGVAASGILANAGSSLSFGQTAGRPNILLIETDQQSSRMLSVAGNPWLNTPAMDSIAQTGIRFGKTYCADPVCVPSRFSVMTGKYPSAIGVRHNGSEPTDAVNAMPQQAMGHFIREAGYETVYGGKVHLPGPMRDITACGFDLLTKNERDLLADECVNYLKQPHDRPFFLMASFINPHDICYMAIRDYSRKLADEGATNRSNWRIPAELDEALKIPEEVSDEEFFAEYCPPLPPNFEIPPEEPDAITYLVTERPFRLNARKNWSEQRWRQHRWTYCRLTELVDAQIGRVLSALDEAGLRQNTLVIFFSDHGDHDSAHRLEHKTTFYEEASHIPLLIRAPGIANPGAVNQNHLVSTGLDILPTICDYAGAKTPVGLQGRSLRPLIEGSSPADWRKTLYLESEIGYMVTDGRYKYSAFDADKGARRDSLVDLANDPGEMRNLVAFTREQDNLARLRALLAQHQRENGVEFEMPS